MWNLSKTEVNNQNKQDTKNDDTSKRDEEHDSTEAVEIGSKKNKKSNERDNYAIVNQSEVKGKLSSSNTAKEIITNDAAPELNIRSKKTKRSKKISESLGQGTEQFNTEISKGPAVSHMEEEPDKKSKEKKKKKNKSDSGSLVNSVEHPLLESLPGATDEKSKDMAVTTKFKDVECSRDAQANNSSATAEDKSVKSKGKKKKKDDSVSDSLLGENFIGDVNGKHSKENDCETPSEDVANKKKSSKKRKRLASEENDFQFVEKKVAEELKRTKVEGLQQSERSEHDFLKSSSKQIDGQANGSIEKNGEKSAFQKTKKQDNGSVEPKTVDAFRRIKAEEVIFTDKRLEDNSYWAKDVAGSGYGAKAQEILGQVRGRDFRHEKTKKKRGTYRGGQIDLQSYSVKFNYSDDE